MVQLIRLVPTMQPTEPRLCVAGTDDNLTQHCASRERLFKWIVKNKGERRNEQRIRLIQDLVQHLLSDADPPNFESYESSTGNLTRNSQSGLHQVEGQPPCTGL
jgi:hypothetical protein